MPEPCTNSIFGAITHRARVDEIVPRARIRFRPVDRARVDEIVPRAQLVHGLAAQRIPLRALCARRQAFELLHEPPRIPALLNRADRARGAQLGLQFIRLDRRVQNYRDIFGGAALFQQLCQVGARECRHVDIEQHDVRLELGAPLRGAERFFPNVNDVACVLEALAGYLEYDWVVVDDEYRPASARTGITPWGPLGLRLKRVSIGTVRQWRV